MSKIILKSAFLTVLALFGGLLLGLLSGSLVFELLPGSSVENVRLGHAAIAAIPALAGFLAGGYVWGVWMARIAQSTDRRRMALSGMLGFAPTTIILAIGLGVAEPVLVENLGAQTPIHRIFTLLFVPAAFLIGGVSAWAIGKGLQDNVLAWSLFWRVGLAAAITFLGVNLVMEASGWVVGAPGAAQRLTMLTVLFAGNLGAALAGGGVMGWILAKRYGRV